MRKKQIVIKKMLGVFCIGLVFAWYGCGDGGGGGGCPNGCPVGAQCLDNQCVCPQGQIVCNNACVNTQNDSNNCGGCNHSCNGAACVNGVCQCPTGQTDCNGTCVDLQTSNSNCGQCGKTCPTGANCVAGACQCPTGQTICDNACVDTMTDKMHCGSCTKQCAEVQTCEAGTCKCPSGKDLCGDQCVDLKTDKTHCGNCETTCPAAQSCVDGKCECPSGKTLCGDQCVDTQTDNRNCGDCGRACAEGYHCVSGDCESLGCSIVPDDTYEGPPNNDSCAAAKALPEAPEGGGVITVGDATLHHQSGSLDEDWYTVYAHEATHICWPGDPQCNFYFDVSLTLPTSVDHTNYQMCVGIGECPTLNPIFCTEEADWNSTTHTYTMTLAWQGTCGLPDSWTFYVKISKSANDNNCDQYTLAYQFYFIEETCE